MIGCVYSDPVMEKIRTLGAGIMEEADRLYRERPAPAPEPAPAASKPAPSKPPCPEPPQRPIAHAHRSTVRVSTEDLYMEEKMKQIRIFLLQVG
ncbi:hypothetical protein OESDEN_19600 [Oesophagostomum dentatum]|uniref:Uncharacterized protein n=1 Tax=Oesophagostomum dentatum TaxID=61180 RepID=A0A0B1SA06_OESDE|nr:hypothetical protein OESDEN_19600 [Oesophagostomum dentatum]